MCARLKLTASSLHGSATAKGGIDRKGEVNIDGTKLRMSTKRRRTNVRGRNCDQFTTSKNDLSVSRADFRMKKRNNDI